MAKTFNKLKPAGLQPTDVITFGKYKDCRVCDVLETDWQYLKWISQNTKITLSKSVLDTITAKWDAEEARIHYENEVKPWEAEGRDMTVDDLFNYVPKSKSVTYGKASPALQGRTYDFVIFDDWQDDIPF